MRRDRGSYSRGGSQHRRVARSPARAVASSQRHPERKVAPPTRVKEVFMATLSPEELIARIMEAEPPEIYLMKDMKKPFTEANVMMSLTNLADKELVHMISWAKKIPGVCVCVCVIVFIKYGRHIIVLKRNISLLFCFFVFLFVLYKIRFIFVVIVWGTGTQPMKCSWHLNRSAINSLIYSVFSR